jgi:hypothetical protein
MYETVIAIAAPHLGPVRTPAENPFSFRARNFSFSPNDGVSENPIAPSVAIARVTDLISWAFGPRTASR